MPKLTPETLRKLLPYSPLLLVLGAAIAYYRGKSVVDFAKGVGAILVAIALLFLRARYFTMPGPALAPNPRSLARRGGKPSAIRKAMEADKARKKNQ